MVDGVSARPEIVSSGAQVRFEALRYVRSMGSFVETVLAIRFAPSTPPEVLAAFRPWIVPSQYGPPPPPIDVPESVFADDPETDELLGRFFEALGSGSVGPYLDALGEPDLAVVLRHWFTPNGTAYVWGEPSASFVYEQRWTFTVRTTHKESLGVVASVVARVGRYVDVDEHRVFVGYLKHEDVPFPNLVWAVPGRGLVVNQLEKAQRVRS